MKGYKAFNNDMTTNHGDNTVYEIDKTYTVEGEIKICENGYHFCKKCVDVYDYYSKPCRICEVSVTGAVQTQGNKNVGRRLKIYKDDVDTILRRLIDLCDTSNMVELPRDKDGEVIRIGDTVYDIDNIKCEVIGYMLDINKVILRIDERNVELLSSAEFLTHKEPITTKSLAQRIKYVLENEATSIGVSPYVELGRIAEQLESLGDSDD